LVNLDVIFSYFYGSRSEMIMGFIKSWTYNIKSCNLVFSHNQKTDRWCCFSCGFGRKTSNYSLPFERCMGRRAPMCSSCSAYNLSEMEHSVLLFPCGELFLKSCQTKHSSTILSSTLKSHVSLYLNHRPVFWKHPQPVFCFTFIAVLGSKMYKKLPNIKLSGDLKLL